MAHNVITQWSVVAALSTHFQKTWTTNLDNIVYVDCFTPPQDRLPELSRLAQDLVRIDRYMPVSCCVLGNFYSQRGNHNMAIVYFQRAVRLDKNNPSAWILLGHEFLELKNSSMAIEAYTKGLGEGGREGEGGWEGRGGGGGGWEGRGGEGGGGRERERRGGVGEVGEGREGRWEGWWEKGGRGGVGWWAEGREGTWSRTEGVGREEIHSRIHTQASTDTISVDIMDWGMPTTL